MSTLLVTADGRLRFGGLDFRCALGRGGCRPEADKREGDGATPLGLYPLRQVLYRPDRFAAPPQTRLPLAPLTPADGWCDDPAEAAYNRPVTLPHAGSHERLWRDDGLYDVILVPGHNDDPPIPGLGSAIFVHVAKPDYAPTEGCVALALPDLLLLLQAVSPRSLLEIRAA
ncbi:L,D-transpeptidase family protein [Ferrovibrio sp.]|uniref:L,D-transpeptidase family protein n=1 Tax=Ferrovibrio sp. TaxID=1917215 RepID=UPI00311DB46F